MASIPPAGCMESLHYQNGSSDFAVHFISTEILTRPTNHSVTISLFPKSDLQITLEYGTSEDCLSRLIPTSLARAGSPFNATIEGLLPDEIYYYRVCCRELVKGSDGHSSSIEYLCGPSHTFHTQRPASDKANANSTFSFGIQADSHPERIGKMFDPALYEQTMRNAGEGGLDFYISLGDDFSIDRLIERKQINQSMVDAVYLSQRKYLGIVGSSTPIFLVNGNHEQAARYLLDGTMQSPAVCAGISRMSFFPQPIPDGFYSGDDEMIEFVGLPGDYYSWRWADALFVVIDPYWHSPTAVDSQPGSKGKKHAAERRNMWNITLGEAQYRWFKKTLEESDAAYKFVFAHHVLGTGRGGIENANLYEWGGRDQKGAWEFESRRPGWQQPIQQLMAENKVDIFFQGHDHLFARQELDGVVYQEVPCPADPTFSAFNADSYTSGTILPNSGYLRVTVSSQKVTVDYVKSYLPNQETATEYNGMVAYSYVLPGGKS